MKAYMKGGGRLEVARPIANHESPGTTKLYHRSSNEISLDEVERLAIYSSKALDSQRFRLVEF